MRAGIVALVVAGCGSRTGLGVSNASGDASVADPPSVDASVPPVPTCAPVARCLGLTLIDPAIDLGPGMLPVVAESPTGWIAGWSHDDAVALLEIDPDGTLGAAADLDGGGPLFWGLVTRGDALSVWGARTMNPDEGSIMTLTRMAANIADGVESSRQITLPRAPDLPLLDVDRFAAIGGREALSARIVDLSSSTDREVLVWFEDARRTDPYWTAARMWTAEGLWLAYPTSEGVQVVATTSDGSVVHSWTADVDPSDDMLLQVAEAGGSIWLGIYDDGALSLRAYGADGASVLPPVRVDWPPEVGRPQKLVGRGDALVVVGNEDGRVAPPRLLPIDPLTGIVGDVLVIGDDETHIRSFAWGSCGATIGVSRDDRGLIGRLACVRRAD